MKNNLNDKDAALLKKGRSFLDALYASDSNDAYHLHNRSHLTSNAHSWKQDITEDAYRLSHLSKYIER